MNPALDIISQIRQGDGSYNAREQNVATFILQNLEEVSEMSLATLAAGANVSEPTVIRFCRTLGCAGFKDFKLRLAQNVAVSLQYLDTKNDENDTPKSLVDQVFQTLYVTANIARSQLHEDDYPPRSGISQRREQAHFLRRRRRINHGRI